MNCEVVFLPVGHLDHPLDEWNTASMEIVLKLSVALKCRCNWKIRTQMRNPSNHFLPRQSGVFLFNFVEDFDFAKSPDFIFPNKLIMLFVAASCDHMPTDTTCTEDTVSVS